MSLKEMVIPIYIHTGARGWIRTNDDNRFCRPTASTTHPHVHFNKKETFF